MFIAEDQDEQPPPPIQSGGHPCTMELGKLEELQLEFADIITGEPGNTPLAEYSIVTGEHTVVKSAPHAISSIRAEEMRIEIEKLLVNGIVRHFASPWASPLVPVMKPDHSVWLCVDYRRLNGITQPDPYCMSLIEDLLHRVGQNTHITKMDLSKGSYQVPVAALDVPKTYFISHMRKFEFLRMLFGLINAPTMFQQLMEVLLNGHHQFAVPYIDDILVFSSSGRDYIEHVRAVLGMLRDAN